jgi:lipoate---protein ligase
LGNRKFSGNAQRRRRRSVLFHGTFLTAFDIALVDQVLPIPDVQPGYRRHRSHADFLTTLPLATASLRTLLSQAWHAEETVPPDLDAVVAQLCHDHYLHHSWNLRF